MNCNFEKITKQVAYSFKRKNPHLDLDEIIGEVNLAAVEAMQTFQENRGRMLDSWIAFMAHRALNKRFYEEPDFLEYFSDMSVSYAMDPERICLAKEAIMSVSQAAKEAVRIVFVDQVFEKQEIKNNLRKKGFAWNKIQTAFCELRRLANSMG